MHNYTVSHLRHSRMF